MRSNIKLEQSVCKGYATISDFSEWKDCSSTYKLNNTSARPYLADLVSVKAIRGRDMLSYKTAFGGPEIDLNFLNARIMKTGVPTPVNRKEPRGIPEEKSGHSQ